MIRFYKRVVAWVSRLQWALRFGAPWWKALTCANRGYHMWNITSDQGPIPPTTCLDCDAEYTEEWHQQKLLATKEV